jgi:hypothetical protein
MAAGSPLGTGGFRVSEASRRLEIRRVRVIREEVKQTVAPAQFTATAHDHHAGGVQLR